VPSALSAATVPGTGHHAINLGSFTLSPDTVHLGHQRAAHSHHLFSRHPPPPLVQVDYFTQSDKKAIGLP